MQWAMALSKSTSKFRIFNRVSSNNGIFHARQRLGEVALVGVLTAGGVLFDWLIGRQAHQRREILREDFSMEILFNRQHGFARKVFDFQPTLQTLVAFFDGPTQVIEFLKTTSRILDRIQQRSRQDLNLAGLEQHSDQANPQRVDRQFTRPAKAMGLVFRPQDDNSIGLAAGDEMCDFRAERFLDPHTKVWFFVCMQGEKPECRVAPVVDQQIVFPTGGQMIRRQLAFSDRKWRNPSVDHEIIEDIVATRC